MSTPKPLDFTYAERQLRKHLLSTVVTPMIRDRYTSSAADLCELSALRGRIEEQTARIFDFVERCARVREQNRAAMALFEYKIVSLGLDCFSRTLPTRWGLKPPKSLGERTHPFDLSIHRYDAVREMVDTSFTGYLDPRHLALNDRPNVIHTRLNIDFNHEKGEAFAAEDFASFIELYRRRIENFLSDTRENHCLFVLHRRHEQPPLRLYDSLCRQMPHEHWHLLVVNTAQQPFARNQSVAIPDRLHLAHIPFPYTGYVWHDAQHFTTAEGERFEAQVVKRIRELILEHFPLRLRAAPATAAKQAAA
jgi:hypothetical protein